MAGEYPTAIESLCIPLHLEPGNTYMIKKCKKIYSLNIIKERVHSIQYYQMLCTRSSSETILMKNSTLNKSCNPPRPFLHFVQDCVIISLTYST